MWLVPFKFAVNYQVHIVYYMDLIVDLLHSSTLASTTEQQPCYLQQISIYVYIQVYNTNVLKYDYFEHA